MKTRSQNRKVKNGQIALRHSFIRSKVTSFEDQLV